MPAERTYVPLMSPPPPLMTADELLRTHVPDKRTELVRGVLVVREPAASRHGLVTMNLGAELAVFAKQTGAGGVYAAESGFKLASNPDTVRAPSPRTWRSKFCRLETVPATCSPRSPIGSPPGPGSCGCSIRSAGLDESIATTAARPS